MVVPVDKKVRLLITANDVIHAWCVPAFGVQAGRDSRLRARRLVQGRQAGTYRGQCAEICGKEHGFMPIVVERSSPSRTTPPGSASRRRRSAAPPPMTPNKIWTINELKARRRKSLRRQLRGLSSGQRQGRAAGVPAAGRRRRSRPVRRPHRSTVVLNGKRAASRRWRPGKQLSDVEIAAVITYARNSWAIKPAVDPPVSRRRRGIAQVHRQASAAFGDRIHGASDEQQSTRSRRTVTSTITRIIPAGIMRWITTTNHKDIGTLYLWFAFTMFLVGGVLALMHPRRAVPARPAVRASRSSSTS